MSSIRSKLFLVLSSFALFMRAAHVDADAGSPPVPTPTPQASAARSTSPLTKQSVAEARKHFTVEVLAFDTSKRNGASAPYSDYVKLRITNQSRLTLPYITPLTKRYSRGNAIGWSRAPAIPVDDLKPEASKIIEYYPHGHISAFPVDKLTVEIEPTIDEEEMRFFIEFQP